MGKVKGLLQKLSLRKSIVLYIAVFMLLAFVLSSCAAYCSAFNSGFRVQSSISVFVAVSGLPRASQLPAGSWQHADIRQKPAIRARCNSGYTADNALRLRLIEGGFY